ncbi:hypothetical protein EJ05DRAFT_511743 [Pseudovirgaria hyperparasitica]|uniref:Uncharacterized protein n=1 Tax=Pseudovirgaria hyperparasitica TaxID=470096 RepID=A0A6A6W317_9PEZI|nr:uncharacterized protein EJ05DRAFT_511743 [Pseudovirgaria hyperparasitica]KAF2756993.1 hypothetical protein EJ05DRAFT_511743 [Pseudovirgaria hyperparasitica]
MSLPLHGSIPSQLPRGLQRRLIIVDLPQSMQFKETERSCYPDDLFHGIDPKIVHRDYRKADRPRFAVPGYAGKEHHLDRTRNCAIEIANASDSTCRGYGSLTTHAGDFVSQSYMTESQYPSIQISINRDVDANGQVLRKLYGRKSKHNVDDSRPRQVHFRIFASQLAEFGGTAAISINEGHTGKEEMLRCISADSAENTSLRMEVVDIASSGRLWMTQVAMDPHYKPTARHNWLGIEQEELDGLVDKFNKDPTQLSCPDHLIAELAKGVASIRLYTFMLAPARLFTYGMVWYKLRDHMYAICQMAKMVGNCWFYRMLSPGPSGDLRNRMLSAPWPRWITVQWSVDMVNGQPVNPQPWRRAPFGMSSIWPDLETQTVMGIVFEKGMTAAQPVLYDPRENGMVVARNNQVIMSDKHSSATQASNSSSLKQPEAKQPESKESESKQPESKKPDSKQPVWEQEPLTVREERELSIKEYQREKKEEKREQKEIDQLRGDWK